MGDRFHILTSFVIFVNTAVLVLKIVSLNLKYRCCVMIYDKYMTPHAQNVSLFECVCVGRGEWI